MMKFDQNSTGIEVVKVYANEVRGKTFLITGPSEGTIGGQTALQLASGNPHSILLAGRSPSKIQPIIDQIKTEHPNVQVIFIKLDLANQASVREAAQEISAKAHHIDVLINNAGVMAIKDYTATSDGIEFQFGTNHIGHFLLTNLLIPKMGKGSRIINVSSLGYISGGVRFDDWNFKDGQEYNPWLAYSQSKTANILFAAALADKLGKREILAFSVNPGLVLESKLQVAVTPEMFADGGRIAQEALGGDSLPAGAMEPVSLAVGTATTIYGALDPSLTTHSGAFLHRCSVMAELRPHALGKDKEEMLWSLSEKLVGQKFEY